MAGYAILCGIIPSGSIFQAVSRTGFSSVFIQFISVSAVKSRFEAKTI